MVYTVMVMAPRKAGVSHETFKNRYEQHMRMIADLSGDAAPLSHTRYYPLHDNLTGKPKLLSGNEDEMPYSVVVLMEFADEQAFGRFCAALATEEAKAKVEADEAGFWEREGMQVMVVEGHGGRRDE